jgi:hypothetical protein
MSGPVAGPAPAAAVRPSVRAEADEARPLRLAFEDRIAALAVFLAVAGSTMVVGLFAGAILNCLNPEIERELIMGAGAFAGLGVGWAWWLAVGSKWVSDETY